MINIAVDGTSASGKSSVSKEIAKRLNIMYLNTGALYRACALYSLENNLNPNDEKDVLEVANNSNLQVKYLNNEQQTFLNGKDISKLILDAKVSETASILSQKHCIREKIRILQKDIAQNNDVLIEGRDIGTEILPNAKYKFFVTASLEERARRRFEQFKQSNKNITYDEVLQALNERDIKDQTRKLSPLKKTDDAILIDTTKLNFEEVVQVILSHIKE